ncbi:hypothetical protein DL766_005558 [Monosporascus sp. MC13-8B]|uniref:Helicase ATP-binding domain-containing protein n=1 Tax=Monosporascus cannonballus TaxID=155416 RepID=A0ABY0HBV2_9PEZI|nr:hypothetical protein DL762_004513 [Monosporascus cannonballus]RYO94719.1 hypothetical protein DL763_003993 [Monosporascus cannonballus]RYP29031.1 hypothetical protein DL766_005558 [Monosporascus sp. MC13-8B]
MNSWVKEIEARLDKSITVAKYYGKGRNDDIKESLDRDIIFTTYHTIAACMSQSNNAIFRIEWFRIILDEAHMIRQREITFYQAASQLSARFRWCLTATPLQNHLEDNYIVSPFDENLTTAAKRFAFLLDCVCLRRPKELLHLTNITEKYQYITLSQDERLQYDETTTTMANFIREKASRNPERRDVFGIFQAQLRLWLLCNHGTFQKPFTKRRQRDRKAEREDFLYSLGSNAEITCSVCGIPIPVFDVIGGTNSYRHPCGRKLCQEWIAQNGDNTKAQETPGPAEPAANDNSGYSNETGFSSKIEVLMRGLEQISSAEKRGILHQRIDGNQILSQRQRNMDRFVADDRFPVLFMSTGVGAFGLNPTVANHVHVLEPQWNPSVESRAIGRVSRLGQDKTVSVTRYLVRRTVEVKMHSQQIRKV